jgi:PAS domain S-box-containing protein
MEERMQCFSAAMFEWIAKPFAIALIPVTVALLWSFPLQHVMAYPFVFLFFAAIMCSAWFGGVVAGVMAVVLSSFLVTFFFIPPLYSLAVGREFRTYETAFIVCAIAITAVSASRRRTELAIRRANDDLEISVRQRTADLQQSNKDLMERESHLRTLTEAIPQQIWRTDAAGAIEYCNHDLLDYLGVISTSAQQVAFQGIFHRDDWLAFQAAWNEARHSNRAFEIKARVRGCDGVYRWFLVRGNPQFAEDGAVARWYGVHIDIERQERSAQELLVAQDRLAELKRNFTMAEMAAAIAHQLKQPLTALTTEAQACRRWLQAQPPNLERAERTADRIVQETARASSVVDRVRSLFSRTDYRREFTDINTTIQSLVRILRKEIQPYEVVIRLQLTNDLPAIPVDPVQIEQVILNLVMNGVEAMADSDSQREIDISTARESANEMIVSVRDFGPGIELSIQERMFEPFFTTKPNGSGMGLAVCRTVIEEHEGRIWAENLEHGAAIRFTLKTT